MVNYSNSAEKGYCLLIIIVNRGKGSKVLQYSRSLGVNEASCCLGRGTVQNNVLTIIEMNEVYKEVILNVVSNSRVDEILEKLNKKFHFHKPNHGIAFTMELSAILKLKQEKTFKWLNNYSESRLAQGEYTGIFLIVDKGKGDTVIDISQTAGYYGGTIIKAHGSASNLNIILDMLVEPEKEAVLMITETDRAHQLTDILRKQLQLNQQNTGILVMLDIDKTLGLYRQKD